MSKKSEEKYLGDGLYASCDGYQVRLRAPRGGLVDDNVYLDQPTLAAFMKYVSELASTPDQEGGI